MADWCGDNSLVGRSGGRRYSSRLSTGSGRPVKKLVARRIGHHRQLRHHADRGVVDALTQVDPNAECLGGRVATSPGGLLPVALIYAPAPHFEISLRRALASAAGWWRIRAVGQR